MNIGLKKLLREVASTFSGAQLQIRDSQTHNRRSQGINFGRFLPTR